MKPQPTKRRLSERVRSTLSSGIPLRLKDLLLILTGTIVVFIISINVDLFGPVISWVYQHDTRELDEALTVGFYLAFAVAVFAWRRHKEFVRNVGQSTKDPEETPQLQPPMRRLPHDGATLRMLVPMCSSCNKIRDSQGQWYQAPEYIETHLPARLYNDSCPECTLKARAV